MTPNPLTVSPGALAAEALKLMEERRITVLFVVEDGLPVGILHIHDLRASAWPDPPPAAIRLCRGRCCAILCDRAGRKASSICFPYPPFPNFR